MTITKRIGIAAGALITLLLAGFVLTSLSIASGVHQASDLAIAEHGGERVTALIAVVDSPTHSLTERNRAVWALGQLGDARALPVLERHRTGAPCDHAHALCQHEIEKAIRACRGSVNVAALLWR